MTPSSAFARLLHRLAVRVRTRPGQSMTEFALAVPVFLLLIFGVFQAAMMYRTLNALNQAAGDAAQALASQSALPPGLGHCPPVEPPLLQPTPYCYQVDGAGLAAIRSALASTDLNSIVAVDVAEVDATGKPMTATVSESVDLASTQNPAIPVTLDNHYTLTDTAGRGCRVDQFYLSNPLGSPFRSLAGDSPSTCVLPLNAKAYNNLPNQNHVRNQNGRDVTRCEEAQLKVTIAYSYSIAMPFGHGFSARLTGQDIVPIEPHTFVGDNPYLQAQQGVCPAS